MTNTPGKKPSKYTILFATIGIFMGLFIIARIFQHQEDRFIEQSKAEAAVTDHIPNNRTAVYLKDLQKMKGVIEDRLFDAYHWQFWIVVRFNKQDEKIFRAYLVPMELYYLIHKGQELPLTQPEEITSR